MIKDKLIPLLKTTFPKLNIEYDDTRNPIAVIPAAHPEVGDILINDDDDEATLFIGDITHNHYNPYDESLSQDQIDYAVSMEVIAFLEALFQDKILLWKTDRGGGGCTHIQDEENMDKIIENNKSFLWSGPINEFE